MKKYFLVFLLGILLLSSCGKKGTIFTSKDIDLFLQGLNEKNFTMKADYEEINSGRLVANVEMYYYVDGNVIYREFYTTFKNEPKLSIMTKVYCCIEDGVYYDYTYQEDYSGNGPEKTYTKEAVSKEQWEKSYDYGTYFIANYNQSFIYRENKQYFTGQKDTTTITLKDNTVQVKNTQSARNLVAMYSKFGATKIKVPSFVVNYKKDEIIHGDH